MIELKYDLTILIHSVVLIYIYIYGGNSCTLKSDLLPKTKNAMSNVINDRFCTFSFPMIKDLGRLLISNLILIKTNL